MYFDLCFLSSSSIGLSRAVEDHFYIGGFSPSSPSHVLLSLDHHAMDVSLTGLQCTWDIVCSVIWPVVQIPPTTTVNKCNAPLIHMADIVVSCDLVMSPQKPHLKTRFQASACAVCSTDQLDNDG